MQKVNKECFWKCQNKVSHLITRNDIQFGEKRYQEVYVGSESANKSMIQWYLLNSSSEKTVKDILVILTVRDEEKWVKSIEKHLAVERAQFKEMVWWRRFPNLYSLVFNHSSKAMGVYMDWIR